MIYKAQDIIRDVRVSLDENAASQSLLRELDEDALALDEVIRSKIEQGARLTLLDAGAHLLEGGHELDGAVYWDELRKGCGWVLLPEDFLRVIVFEMSDWLTPVTQTITPDDPLYAVQRSLFRGVRGTPQRPVCAVAVRPEGRVLEFYSSRDDTAWLRRGLYAPEPRIDRGDGIDLPERCLSAAVYRTAALTLTAYGEAERAQLFNELSKTALA
jgi:hypothetical protein